MFKRVNSDVVPFSINSPAGNRYVFGTADVSNDIDANYNENIKKGFGTGPNEFPELEDFNALMFTGSYLAAYLYQAGIPEWNDKQKYYINSIAMGSDGNIYRSLAGTEETPNVNNNPILAGSVTWKSIFSEYAKINGDETKKFKVATPEGDYDAVNKKYLDENSLKINSLPEKTIPADTDNLAIQETGGLLKKVSFENLTKLSPNDNRVKTALNASGEAPIYACRAWVNFNGTGTVAIRASGNVSSVSDVGTGRYEANLILPMSTEDSYTVLNSCNNNSDNPSEFTNATYSTFAFPYTSTKVRIRSGHTATNQDVDLLCITIATVN